MEQGAGATERNEPRRWAGVAALLIGSFLLVGLVPARLDAEASERAGVVRSETPVRVRADLRGDLLALTNVDRASRGLRALGPADWIARYAVRHSRRMADLGYVFHSGDEQLRRALEGSGWSVAGENVGAGATLGEVQDAFMRSAPHRHNVLEPSFDHAAVGIVEADGVVWVTVVFSGD